jgi:plastocyanin
MVSDRKERPMTIRRLTGPAVLALALMLVGAACGNSGGSNNGATNAGSGGGGLYGGGNNTSMPTSGTGGGSAGKPSLTVEQTSSFTFSPTTVKVKSGSTIEVLNTAGQSPHTFTVQGQGIDITNDSGQSQNVKIDLKAGTYQFFCKFHGSPGQGMHGTLVVT